MHLLLGLLREEKCLAAEILHERGLRLSQVREEIARSSSEKMTSNRPKESSLLAEFSRDLTQAAADFGAPARIKARWSCCKTT